MDAHLFRSFCDAATPLLVGSRVEKLQEPAPDSLVVTLFGAYKQQLCLRFGRKEPFCFLTRQRVTVGHAPSASVMRLRKYTTGRRVAACVAQWCARRLWLLLSNGPANRLIGDKGCAASLPDGHNGHLLWLLLDLREGASIHYLSEEASPEEETLLWPAPEELATALEHWRQWPVLTPALRRSLVYLEKAEQWALLQDLCAGGGDVFCYGIAPEGEAMPSSVRHVSAWPLPPALQQGLLMLEEAKGRIAVLSGPEVLPLLERAGQDLVLARLAQQEAHAAAVPLVRRVRKLTRLLDKLHEEEQRLTAMVRCHSNALALQENIWRWPADAHMALVHVAEGAHGPARDIALDIRHTVREEMDRLFHVAKRGKRGLELLSGRRTALEAELADTRAMLSAGAGLPGLARPVIPAGGKTAARPSGLPKNVQLFVSSDGFTLLRGRDAKGNLAVHRLAAGHDIWLHTANGPGAHVIIRRAHGGQEVPDRTLEEAGALAAVKSWQKDAARARIQYAEVRHVKPMRNAPAGTVRIDKSLPSREVVVDASVEERLLPAELRQGRQ